jgi:hypothetical protein
VTPLAYGTKVCVMAYGTKVCVMAYGIFFCLKMEMRTRRRLCEP